MATKRQSTTKNPLRLSTPTIPRTGKFILFDRETRDYGMYYEGQLVGFARTYLEAEATLDELHLEVLRHTTVETADLDAMHDAAQALLVGESLPFDLEAELLAEYTRQEAQSAGGAR